MGDLNTPPPSYELAMGIPGSSTKNQQYFPTPIKSAPPTAPPLDNDIVSAPITTPMLPQLSRPSTIITAPQQRIQPAFNQHVYPTNRPPQEINLRRQQSTENENKTYSCIIIVLVILSVLVYILVKVARAGSLKTKHSSPSYTSYSGNSYYDSNYNNRYFGNTK